MATIRVQTPDANDARDLAHELGELGVTDVERSGGGSSVVLTWPGGLDPVAWDAFVVVERWARTHRIGFVKVRVDRDPAEAIGARVPAARGPQRTMVQRLARRLGAVWTSVRRAGPQPPLADDGDDDGDMGSGVAPQPAEPPVGGRDA